MREKLKDIPGYEGLYAITQSGMVWSYPKKHGRSRRDGFWMRPQIARGYRFVVLQKDRRRKTQHIHRLIAICWIPRPKDTRKTQVNHRDGVKTHNSRRNLEWVTPSQNIRHAFSHGLSSQVGSRNGGAKLSESNVRSIRRAISRGAVKRRISERYCVCPSVITKISQGKLWTHVK